MNDPVNRPRSTPNRQPGFQNPFKFTTWCPKSDSTSRECISVRHKLLRKFSSISFLSRFGSNKMKKFLSNSSLSDSNSSIDNQDSSSNCSTSTGPLTPVDTSPLCIETKLVSNKPNISFQRKVMSCDIPRTHNMPYQSAKKLPSQYAMSMDLDRCISRDLAMQKLKSIQSFDDMIENGFEIDPALPRAFTVTFSLTPILQSDMI